MIHLQHTIRIALILAVLGLFLPAVGMADPVQEGIAAFEAEDYERAYELLKPEASEGDADAQYYLARMYDHAYGVEHDAERALELFFDAANGGNVNAQRTIGYSYLKGIGVPQDHEQSVSWYRKAAEAGDPSAQRSMGFSYKNGEGVQQDDARAVEWFRRGAEQGDLDSQYELGIAYFEGMGVEQDYEKAFHWNEKAAEAGKIHSSRLLSWQYELGRGVEQNLDLAGHLMDFVLSQAGDSQLDHFRMAMILSERARVSHSDDDWRRSAEHFREAARRGHMLSMLSTGMAYKQGRHFERDLVEAYAWMRLAEHHGMQGIDSNLRTVRARMGQAERAAGRVRADELREMVPVGSVRSDE